MKFLAIDFGDGTTCAASYDSTMGQLELQRIVTGKDEIPTIMRVTRDGRVAIGERATATLDPKNDALKLNWKRRPTDDIGEEGTARRADTILYMRAVFEGLRDNGAFGDQNIRTCIGVPCDWSDEDIDLYRQMAEEAGFTNVCVLRESQAAVLYAMKFMTLANGASISSTALQRGVFLIDVGSSTTDFTYIRGMSGVHCGYDLGARYIDRIIWKSVLRNQEEPRFDYERLGDGTPRSYQEQVNLRNWHVTKCRFMKECYFSAADQDGMHTQLNFTHRGDGTRYSFEWCDDNGNITRQLCHDLFDTAVVADYAFSIPHFRVLGNASWREHFRSILQDAADKCHVDIETVTIVVTGGATRMNFILDDIRSVFGNNTEILFGEDRDRSFSVVRGLAWAAYADYEINRAKMTLHDRIWNSCKDAVEAHIKKKVFEPKAKQIAESVSKQLCWELNAHSANINTINKLKNRESELITKELNSVLQEINRGDYALDSVLELLEVKSLTENLHNKFARQDIVYEKRLHAVFSWHWRHVKGCKGFYTGFFDGQISNLPSSDDEEFSESRYLGFIESHFDVAARSFENNFDTSSIMALFEDDTILDEQKQIMPSDIQRCRDVILEKLEEYITLELDALAGRFTINHD